MFAGLLRKWIQAVLVFCLTLSALWQAYQWGRQHAGIELFDLRETNRGLRGSTADLAQEKAALLERIAILERSIEIDHEAYRGVNSSLQKMESDILEQQQELAFYRGIVAPAHAQTGLRIQSLELTAGSAPRQFRYSLLLTQVVRISGPIEGEVRMQVNGSQAGEPKSLSLTEISRPKLESLRFQFRYFQSLDGELELPGGFQPDTMQVEVFLSGSGKPKLERVFGWPV